MRVSVLCYLIENGRWLMLHRCKKSRDPNEGKWIGIGGGLEEGESPEEACDREFFEETGLTLTDRSLRGVITFVSDSCENELMFLFAASGYRGQLHECDEGDLYWKDESEIPTLPTWEGDRLFLRKLRENVPFFSMKLIYQGDRLVSASCDGKELEFTE